MEEKNNKVKKNDLKTKPSRQLNWSLILLFFLIGFMITLPSLIVKVVPAQGSRITKVGKDIFLLADDNTIVHLRDRGVSVSFVEKITNGNTLSKPMENSQLAYSGNKFFVIKENSVDIYIYDVKDKKFKFSDNIDWNAK
jgi:hypothetical protein